MNINELITNLEAREGKRKSYDFRRMRALLNELDNPHRGLKYLHVAGTNGKGSTSNFLYNILKSGGYKVGLYTSPHLERYNERIKINDVEISDEDFVSFAEKVFIAEKNIENNFEQLTFFEFITAICFMYFKREQCEYCVLEVGMGGLSDSTNVIDKEDTLACLITPVSMDHTQFLGNNITEIAYQKSGIIKEGVDVFSSNTDPEVIKVLKEVSLTKNADFFDLNNIDIKNIDIADYGCTYDLIFNCEELKNIKINLVGYYQMYNSALSVMTILQLRREKKIDISNEAILDGLANTFWAGRMEKIYNNPQIVLDGAHNFDGIINLTKNFKLYEYNKLYIIASILNDKEHDKMLNELAKYADEIILTGLHTKRKTDLEILQAEASKSSVSVYIIEDLKSAIRTAKDKATDKDLIIISGSLYLVSETKEIINDILD